MTEFTRGEKAFTLWLLLGTLAAVLDAPTGVLVCFFGLALLTALAR